MKDKLPLLAAIVFGIIAFVGINQYVRDQRVTTPKAQIVAARASKLAGDLIQREDLGLITVDLETARNMRGTFSADERSLLVDQRLARDITPGEPIFRSHLAQADDTIRIGKFSEKLSPGERAISLPMDNTGAISNFVRVDDRVDILANFDVPKTVVRTFSVPDQGVQTFEETTTEPTTVFMFENVRVLAVGSTFEENPDDMRFGGGGAVTFAVSPREAQILTWAMRNGGGGGGGDLTFTLLLRSPEDQGTVSPRDNVTYEDLLDITRMQELQEARSRRMAAD